MTEGRNGEWVRQLPERLGRIIGGLSPIARSGGKTSAG